MDFPIESMLKDQLKAFLSNRGMTVSDYNVVQLREIARKAVELNLPVIKTPDDTANSIQVRTRVVVDGEVVQFPFALSPELNKWNEDLKAVPSFSEADVFVYLLSRCEWSPDRLSRYKSERGYGLYTAHHVHSLLCHQLSHSHIYIKSKCIRETSQSSHPYNTWILMNESGNCVSGGCDCTGDDGGCKHVLCLMLSVANWSSRHEDRHTETCTDIKCVWDEPKKTSNPRKLDDIKDTSKVQPYLNVYTPMVHDNLLEAVDLDDMMSNLVRGHDAQICEILNVPNDVKSALTLQDCADRYDDSLPVLDYLSTCFSEDDFNKINIMTQGQSDNPEWFKHRTGRLTSSVMAPVFKYRGTDEDNYIVRQVLGLTNYGPSAAMLYGKDREPLARKLYESQYATTHKCGKVTMSGLFINKNMPHVGASPDGIVKCTCCGMGVLEIKCPYKFKNLTVDEICSENYHVQKDENGHCVLKHTSDWYIQIQTQMAVAGVLWCDFVLYLEGNIHDGKHQIHVERIAFDELLWQSVLKKSILFFQNFVWPKLLP